MPDRPLALVSNDDGIRSRFLCALVAGMQSCFEVAVVAPSREQSWVSRGMSRHDPVAVRPYAGFDCPAWEVDGTPSDCVNIGIGHLLEREPDIVVSGINVGYNATETLVFSSGTVAAALEAAVWRIPAVAASKWLPKEVWERARADNNTGTVEARVHRSVDADGRRVARFALEQVGTRPRDMIVHNLNFPLDSGDDTPIVGTRPAPLRLGSLFERKPEGHFLFTYARGEVLDQSEDTDIATIFSGKISYSVLNFSRIGQKPNGKKNDQNPA